mgnify:CR=1 FL=1
MEIDINFENRPNSFIVCWNEKCLLGEKCLRRIETMVMLNRLICWMLMVCHNYVTTDDIPLISIQFEYFMDCCERISALNN